MARYSASRGIRYSAPPGPDGNRTDGAAEGTDADEEPPVDAGADPDAGREGVAADDD